MKRGDLIIVSASGDDGKPRPAVILQTAAIPSSHQSVIVCQLTFELEHNSDLRVTIEPRPENGLRLTSQIMSDKPVTIRRNKISQRIGQLSRQGMAKLNKALTFCLGLAD